MTEESPEPIVEETATEAEESAEEQKPAKKAKAKKEKKPKPPRDEKNGIARPGKGVTLRVWEICDALTAQLGRVPTRANVMEVAQAEEINDKTIATQYARWRGYNGITGRVMEPKPEPEMTDEEKVAAE